MADNEEKKQPGRPKKDKPADKAPEQANEFVAGGDNPTEVPQGQDQPAPEPEQPQAPPAEPAEPAGPAEPDEPAEQPKPQTVVITSEQLAAMQAQEAEEEEEEPQPPADQEPPQPPTPPEPPASAPESSPEEEPEFMTHKSGQKIPVKELNDPNIVWAEKFTNGTWDARRFTAAQWQVLTEGAAPKFKNKAHCGWLPIVEDLPEWREMRTQDAPSVGPRPDDRNKDKNP